MATKQKFEQETGLDPDLYKTEYIKWMESELAFRERNKAEISKSEMDIAKVMDMEHPDNFEG